MERSKFFQQFTIDTASQLLLKVLPFLQEFLKRFVALFLHGKVAKILHDVGFVLSLLLFSILAVFCKDFISDQQEIRDSQHIFQKSLGGYIEKHTDFFLDLKEKILAEKLQHNLSYLQYLFRDLSQLKNYASGAPILRMTSGRWVTSELKAIGMYGEVQNFDHKSFLPFLRSLETVPGVVHIAKIDNQIYAGIGIKDGSELKGYLLFPASLEKTIPLFPNLKFFQVSYEISLPPQGVPLNELAKQSFSFFKPHQTIEWSGYVSENLLAYALFVLGSLGLLFLKRKSDCKKEQRISTGIAKIQSLAASFAAQQQMANLLLGRFHDTNESIMEISHLLLEAKSQAASHVLSEKEQTKLVKKINEATCLLGNQLISGKSPEIFKVSSVLDHCLSFYSSRILEESIRVEKDYTPNEVTLEADKGVFLQLILNLLHKALERTPEEGKILIRLSLPPEEEGPLFELSIEDNGYAFSAEELKHFKKHDKTLFENYFDLEWEKIITLGRNLKAKISLEKTSGGDNRMVVFFARQALSKEDFSYGDNIIKLFPGG